jgi:16S rRNA (guanine1516-N2)-methyltransferase
LILFYTKNIVIASNRSLSIAVCPTADDQDDRAMQLAGKLSIPLVQDSNADEYSYLLLCTAAGLSLKKTGINSPGPIMISFTSGPVTYRIRHGGGRRQALARAVGLKKGWQPRVIDATAGLGRDGFILASLGCHVHMLERSPILTVLLDDALQRALRSEKTAAIVTERLQLTCGDSREFLQKLRPEAYPDIIYLDPMYPERTKSSLVKKEMRVLRGLAGDDLDAAELLTIGRGCVRNRVVVKRPRLAPTLDSITPSHQITGKTSRFDVYLV